MADEPKNPAVDPDEPTEQYVKHALDQLPTWEEWLRQNGFLLGKEDKYAWSDREWNRHWPSQGRGWQIRIHPERNIITADVYNNILRWGRSYIKFFVNERTLPKVVGQIIKEIERNVSDQSRKRRIKALKAATPDEVRVEPDETPYNGPVLPIRVVQGDQPHHWVEFHNEALKPNRQPVPEDPSEYTPEQMDALLNRLQTRCFQTGTRVRVRTQRQTSLNGLMGTVVDAGPHACYVAIDDYVNAGDPDPFRFEEQELEPVYESVEADDPDSPQQYLAALDYITVLKQLGFTLIDRTYRKHVPLGQGSLRLKVEPIENVLFPMATGIDVEYFGGELERIQQIVVNAIDVVDTVREIERMAAESKGISEFAERLEQRNFPGGKVTGHDHLLYLFGESVLDNPEDPDDPERYIQDLQRHYDVINAFRAHGVKMRRRMRADHPYYEMFWIPNAVTEVSYDIYLQPDGQDWAVSAEGLKSFQDDRWGEYQEKFDIDRRFELGGNLSADELAIEVDNILSALTEYQGPEEPTIPEPDYDDIDESEGIDDPREYAFASADYNPVYLLSSKDVRKIVRDAGYRVGSIYRSRIHKGWVLNASPATDERFEAFRQSEHREEQYLDHMVREGLKARFPALKGDLDEKFHIHVWHFGGATSANPDDPHNWSMYIDILPADYMKRKRGGGMIESEEDEGLGDLRDYVKTSGNACSAIEQAGYTYGFDRLGRERWNKYWPLPQPLRHQKPWSPIWTKLWGSPDPWGQYVWGIMSEDFVNATAGGYIVVKPVEAPGTEEGWDYTTSVRRVLLKVEQMVRNLPTDTTEIDVMRNHIFHEMERIKDEVNAEAEKTIVGEAVTDPADEPDAMLNQAQAAKMGDTVEVKCPQCGATKLLGKNWPDNFKGWGTTCDQCQGFVPLGNEIVFEAADPDDPDVALSTHKPKAYALYAQSEGYDHAVSFGTYQTLGEAVEQARDRDLHNAYEYVWAEEYEFASLDKWGTGETMACEYTGTKYVITPDYRSRKVTDSYLYTGHYPRPPNPMQESEDFDDIDNPEHYATTTFDPVAFLQAAGWKKLKTEAYEYWHKDFPLPRQYWLGGMGFTKLRVTVGFDPRFVGGWAASVNIYWIDDEGHGFPVKGWNLDRQIVRPLDPFEEELPPEKEDHTMPIRRFVMGIGDVLSKLPYPENERAVLHLNTYLEADVSKFVRDLNQRAEQPLYDPTPWPQQESAGADDPEPYIQSLGTIDHVMALHGMGKIYRDENEGGWMRTFKLPRPAITHINDKPDDPMVELSGKVNELRLVVVYKKVPDSTMPGQTLHDVKMFVRVPEGAGHPVLWGTSEVFKTEHEAARSLSTATEYAVMSLENNHPTDTTELTRLRQILQMGVGPFLKREDS